MRKIISCILAMAMLLSVVCVSATTQNHVNASYNATEKKILINGTFEQPHGNITVFVSKYIEGTVDSYDDITADNISQYVVQMNIWDGKGDLVLPVNHAISTGFYIVLCGASGFSSVESKVFYITDENEQNKAVDAFKTATPETIATAITDWVANKPVVSLDLANSLYTENTTEVQKTFANCIMEEVAKLTASSQPDEFTIVNVVNCYEKALALVDFNMATDKALKYQKYASLLGAENESVTDGNRESVVALMPSQTDAENGKFFFASSFQKALNKSVAICAVNGKSRDEIRAALKANEEIIGIDVDAGYATAKESELNAAMALGSFATTEEIKTAFETAVADNPKRQSGGSSSGGSSGGGTTVIGRPTIVPEPDVEKYPGYVPPKDVFYDISDYTWAKDAIIFLNEKEIISGDGNGKFEPARNIKREEYAKILVEAFALKNEGEAKEFVDVEKDAWYYEYIQTAYKNGIINGIDEESFGTGSLVTRQDAAVMIYRYLQDTGYKFSDEFAIDFADIDDCAEYAKTAVKKLKNSGLIKGNGDNTFLPGNFLSRAETAILIYNIMSEVEAK